MTRLPRAFFARAAEQVAPALLGAVLAFEGEGGVRRGRIVETEAYLGAHDLACHAAKGRTRRTEVMFGPAGRLYVYLIYGMYDMLNIVTGPEGEPQAVLIRALQPVTNLGRSDGPGKLCRALGVSRAHNGLDLCAPEAPLWLEPGEAPSVATSPRVGIDYAGAWRDAPLRFYDPASPHVSRPPRQSNTKRRG